MSSVLNKFDHVYESMVAENLVIVIIFSGKISLIALILYRFNWSCSLSLNSMFLHTSVSVLWQVGFCDELLKFEFFRDFKELAGFLEPMLVQQFAYSLLAIGRGIGSFWIIRIRRDFDLFQVDQERLSTEH